MTRLLPGELLDWTATEAEHTATIPDAAIDEKYQRGEVRIVTEQGRYPLNAIPTMLKGGGYELNPEFQRRRLWSPDKQSRLIESFIMNVPVPPIFLYEDRYGHYEVMDGLQRLSAITDFYEDRLTLVGLEEWAELNGRTYRTLPEQVRKGIDRRYLSSVVLLYETAKDPAEAQRLKQLVFERINSGGVKLSPQETRNALHAGRMNRLCVELSRNPSLCRLWDIPIAGPDEAATGVPSRDRVQHDAFRRMEDVALVLRFFAHRQRTSLLKSGPLERYFDRFLRSANEWPQQLLDDLKVVFTTTIDLVESVLGARAFWLWRERGGRHMWVDRPAVIAYDPVMHAFSEHLKDADTLRARRDAIQSSMQDFYEKNYGAFDGRKVNSLDIARRDEVFGAHLRSFLA
jgi:hypothetical protein